MAIYIAIALIMFFYLSFKLMKNFDIWYNKLNIFTWPVAGAWLAVGTVYWPLTLVVLMLMFIADVKKPAVQHES